LSNPHLKLYRAIGTIDMDGQGTAHALAAVDPFIFMDEARIEGHSSSSFQKHPHTGLVAVTYLLEGTVHAWDNIHGATPELNHVGGVYCVDAGRGIVHGEAPIEGDRKVRLLQMWYNPGLYEFPLPKANYQLFQPGELPVYEDENVWVKVIIGEALHLTSPVSTRWPICYTHIRLAPQKSYRFEMPDPQRQGFIYVLEGQGAFGIHDTNGTEGQCLVLDSEITSSILIKNPNAHPLEFILAVGQPHNKPFVKLLGHGGALVAGTELHARVWMKNYEKNPELFGRDDLQSMSCDYS
jgi:quercetin 2,3-dioxygenase